MRTHRSIFLPASLLVALGATLSPWTDGCSAARADGDTEEPGPCWEKRFQRLPLVNQDTPPAPPPETPPAGGDPAPAPPQEKPADPPTETPATPNGAAEKPAEAPAPASDAPPVDVPTDEEDAAARAILEVAAKRQGGDKLAPPGGTLESFAVEFRKVTVHRVTENADGGVTRKRMDSEQPGLIVHWKGTQIREEWYLSGEKPTIRGIYARAKPDGTTADFPWLSDGTAVKSLKNAGYEKDLGEVERDRRVIKAMLQAAILRGLLSDGSRWKLVDDPAFAGTALRRTPPAGAETPLRLTLWIDPKTNDVAGAKLAPNEPGESTMYYGLTYVDGLPKVKGDVVRFPVRFRVMEQRIPEQEPMDVLDATVSEASFNDVPDERFKPAVK